MKYLLFVVLAFALIFTSCKKDTPEPDNDNIENPSTNITADAILVQTEDQNGNAISGVQVTIGSETKTTDANGVVQFSSIILPSQNVTISSSKTGYFDHSYVINPSSDEELSVIVTMATASNTTIDASTGGQVQCGGGAYIDFPANGFLDQNGSLYNGNVLVSSKFIDPSSSVNNQIIPNSFTGIDESNSTVFVENHGMILAEIYDVNGNELTINPSNKAQLHIPVLSTDVGNTPADLPLYYFNESAGQWIEDGQATLNANEYVGEVAHFTFWMCPYVYDHYSLSGSLVCGTTPYSGAVVNVYNQYGHFLGSTTTNVVGGFSGSIPGTLTHTLEIEDPCGDVLYSEQIGPFSSSTSLGQIDICSGGTVNYGVVETTLTDCNGVTDQDAYLNVQFSGKTRFFPANSTGSFSRLIVFCNTTTDVTIVGANPISNLSSIPQTQAVNPTMNFGNQLICNLPDEYCSYTLNGDNYFITDLPEIEFTARVNISSPSLSYIGVIDTVNPGPNSSVMQHFQIRNFGPTTGQYLIPGNGGLGFVFEGMFPTNGDTFPIDITYLGSSVGDYVEGTITGGPHTYIDGYGDNVTISQLNFRLRIDEYTP